MAKRATKRKQKTKPAAEKRISFKKHQEELEKQAEALNDKWRKTISSKEEKLDKKQEEPKNECKSSPEEPVLCVIAHQLKENNDVLSDRLNDLYYKVGAIKNFTEPQSKKDELKDKEPISASEAMQLQIQRSRNLIHDLTGIVVHLSTII